MIVSPHTDLPEALYLADQCRKLDSVVIEEYAVPGIDLMRRAGEAAFRVVTENFSSTQNMVVVCGTGNNGGDGYVVAFCALRIGIAVRVIATGPPGTPDARQARDDYVNAGGEIAAVDETDLSTADLLVDALFGIGLNRAPDGLAAALVRTINESPAKVIALDIASGLCSDTGQAFDPCIRAEATVTFIGLKLGLFTAEGPSVSGEIRFDDLDIPIGAHDAVDCCARIIRPPSFAPRPRHTHKGQAGRLWVAGGDQGMLGAALLAGETALRSGSGLVTVLSTRDHLDLPALRCASLMSAIFDDTISTDVFSLPDAVVLGPGLGLGEWGKRVFEQFVDADVPRVIDADGLNWLAAKPRRSDRWVLTPHPGEAARLLDCSVGEIQSDRVKAVRTIVERYGGVCILKGTGTLIGSSDGRLFLCDRGNPGMATAGMGDVLTGLVGSLLGQGMCAQKAATSAVWMHSTAADRLVPKLGEHGLIADDMPAAIGALWPELEVA